MLTEIATVLLEARGLDMEACVREGLESHAPRGRDARTWITIPYWRGGKVVARKYRTLDGEKGFYQDPGGQQCFWRIDSIRDTTLTGPIIITEGELDCLPALMAGFERAISVPDGAPPPRHDGDSRDANSARARKYGYVAELVELIEDERDIVLAVDNDEAGKVLLNDLAFRLGSARCRYCVYPEGCKDLGDVLREHSVEAVRDIIENARPIFLNGVYRPSELPPVPDYRPIELGLGKVDDHFRPTFGTLTTIIGIPNSGKTTLVFQLTEALAERSINVCIASFESRNPPRLRRTLRMVRARKLDTLLTDQERAGIDAWIDDRYTFLYPTLQDDVTPDWFLERARWCIVRRESRAIIVDPYNNLDVKPEYRGQFMPDRHGDIIKQFRQFADRFGIMFFVVAHPPKLKVENGHIQIPSIYDAAGTAHFANYSDNMLIVHRMKQRAKKGEPVSKKDYTLLRVAKIRDQPEMGRLGDVTANYSLEERRLLFEGQPWGGGPADLGLDLEERDGEEVF